MCTRVRAPAPPDPALLTALAPTLPPARARAQYDTMEECNAAICACWSGQASSLAQCKDILADDDYKPDPSCAVKVRLPRRSTTTFSTLPSASATSRLILRALCPRCAHVRHARQVARPSVDHSGFHCPPC